MSPAMSPGMAAPWAFGGPGAWEAAVAQQAAVQQFWAAQWGAADWSSGVEPSMLMTPMRKQSRADENASPNVVDLLLQNSAEKESMSRPTRRAKGKTPNPKTPVKMAPVVSADSPIKALSLTPSPKKDSDQSRK